MPTGLSLSQRPKQLRKYEPLERTIPTSVADAAHEYERPFVEFGKVLREFIRKNNRNSHTQAAGPFQYGKDIFGVSSLSKYLSTAARALKIIDEKQSFINTNRRMWDK
jgi:hypothetical protein